MMSEIGGVTCVTAGGACLDRAFRYTSGVCWGQQQPLIQRGSGEIHIQIPDRPLTLSLAATVMQDSPGVRDAASEWSKN